MKINKTKVTSFIAIGACFACVPLYIFKVFSITTVLVIFGISLATLILLVTGVLGKLFNKK